MKNANTAILNKLLKSCSQCMMLQVHAANKPIDRSNDDQVLHRIAELAVGYSGAELANLLNEAAILAVRNMC